MDGGLAERAVRLLRAHGGRVGEPEMLLELFGYGANPERWSGLVRSVLEPLSNVHRASDGCWELVEEPGRLACKPTELTFVAIATAVTGLDPWRGRIAAIAAVRTRGRELLGSFESLLNPRRHLPRYLVEKAGLSPVELEEAPVFGDLADDLLDFLGGDPLVGMEIRAQADALSHELSRLDRAGLRNPLLDLGELSARVRLSSSKPSLSLMASAAGLSNPRPYYPPADARVAARLTSELLASAEASGLLDSQLLFGSRQPQLRGALLQVEPPDAPHGPGVYLLKDSNDNVLYVGKARDLRSRLRAYHRSQLGLLRRLEGLAAAADDIETLPVSSDLQAMLVEARLIRECRPIYNTQRRSRSPSLYLRADLRDSAVTLSLCGSLAADGARYVGPFRTSRGAAATLRLMHQLFPGLKGRAKAEAATRRPLLQQALRFISGQKREVLDRLRREQGKLATAGDRPGLDASRALLRRALAFEIDSATLSLRPLEDRLMVLSPTSRGFQVHLIESGRLIDCFGAVDEAEASASAQSLLKERKAESTEGDADESNIIFRWLFQLGPEHRVVRL